MTPAEYILKAQDLLEFQLKVSRYYVELWKDYPWLVSVGEETLPAMYITIDAPLGRNDSQGAFGFDDASRELFYTPCDDLHLTFDQVKNKLFGPFILAVCQTGFRYMLGAIKAENGGNVMEDLIQIDAFEHLDLSKGFKTNLKSLCEKYDNAVKAALKNEETSKS